MSIRNLVLLVLASASLVAGGARAAQYQDLQAVRNLPASAMQGGFDVAEVVPGSGSGAGHFQWTDNCPVKPDGFFAIRPASYSGDGCAMRQPGAQSVYDVTWWGANPDGGTTDNFQAISSAIAFVNSLPNGGTVFLPQTRSGNVYGIDTSKLNAAPFAPRRNVSIACGSTNVTLELTGSYGFIHDVIQFYDPMNNYVRNCHIDVAGKKGTAVILFSGRNTATGPMGHSGVSDVTTENATVTGDIRIENAGQCDSCRISDMTIDRFRCLSAPGNDPNPAIAGAEANCIRIEGQLVQPGGSSNINGTVGHVTINDLYADLKYKRNAIMAYYGVTDVRAVNPVAENAGAGAATGFITAYSFASYSSAPTATRTAMDGFTLINPTCTNAYEGCAYFAGTKHNRIVGGHFSGQFGTNVAGIEAAAIHCNSCLDSSITGMKLADNYKTFLINPAAAGTTVTFANNSIQSSRPGAIAMRIAAARDAHASTTIFRDNHATMTGEGSVCYELNSGSASSGYPGTVEIHGGQCSATRNGLYAHDGSRGSGYTGGPGARVVIDNEAYFGGPTKSYLLSYRGSDTPLVVSSATFDGAQASNAVAVDKSSALSITNAHFRGWRGGRALQAEGACGVVRGDDGSDFGVGRDGCRGPRGEQF
ncbi:MAG: hypothetical protein KGJ78_00220 [Alphaproteobacteria bacterium]|nr:hypothetical protein [Alphaproteobacteria bacterium]